MRFPNGINGTVESHNEHGFDFEFCCCPKEVLPFILISPYTYAPLPANQFHHLIPQSTILEIQFVGFTCGDGSFDFEMRTNYV